MTGVFFLVFFLATLTFDFDISLILQRIGGTLIFLGPFSTTLFSMCGLSRSVYRFQLSFMLECINNAGYPCFSFGVERMGHWLRAMDLVLARRILRIEKFN